MDTSIMKSNSTEPVSTLQQVIVASFFSCNSAQSPSNAVADMASSQIPAQTKGKEGKESDQPNKEKELLKGPSDDLKFLNRAIQPKPIHKGLTCTVQQVEDVKIVIKILPIFLSTIMLSCCLAQLSTFSVQQATTMDTKVGSLKVPPASLPVFPVVFIMIVAPLYDHIIIPFFRKLTKSEMGITHLQRIGIGLVLSIVAMVVAAVVENKRKHVAYSSGLADSGSPLPITFFWIAFQYLFLGSADLFTLAALLEFFFTEAPLGMKSLATSLSWASLAMGYYLSSVLVSTVNSVTGKGGHKAWLTGPNLNHYHLERFYWLMCVLSSINFVQYLFWATRYKYRSTGNI